MNSGIIELAAERLLAPNELDVDVLGQCLHGLMRPGIDTADLYLQRSSREHWSLEDNRA